MSIIGGGGRLIHQARVLVLIQQARVLVLTQQARVLVLIQQARVLVFKVLRSHHIIMLDALRS